MTYYDRAHETMDREGLRSLQWDKLAVQLPVLFKHNAFYRKKWTAAGLKGPGDVATWEDFAAIPFTIKEELVADQEENPPFGSVLTFPLERYVRLHQTSGTMGKPLRWLDTDESWDWWARCWCYVYHGAGVTAKDRLFFAFSFGPFIGFWSGLEGARKMGALAIPGGGLTSEARLTAIIENQATVLVCTPSYALRLAEIAKSEGLDIAGSAVARTIHAGEPGASLPSTRRRIEELWGARCYDHHGMTEVGAMSFTCSAQAGVHLIETEFIFEVIDPATGQPAGPGVEGELVVTNLGRVGMPVVRYRTGDRVKMATGRCECGRTFALLEGGILGRTDDMLIVRGINVFPSAVENIVREFGEVAEFTVDVYKRENMHELALNLELEPWAYGECESSGIVQKVTGEIRRRLSIRVEGRVVPPGSLPRYELKSKRFVRR